VATESVSSSGTFWARVTRTKKEEACFVDDMERMGLVLFYNYMYSGAHYPEPPYELHP